MTFFKDLLSNHMFVCAFVAYFAAQIIKIIVLLIRERRLDFGLLFASGGMPSSHSSTAAALCVSSARLFGLASPIFAITFVLSGIVMYDAAGVRRAAGEHARVLNQLLRDLTSGDHERTEKGLKELIGHTPVQVVVGALLGIAVPFLVPLP